MTQSRLLVLWASAITHLYLRQVYTNARGCLRTNTYLLKQFINSSAHCNRGTKYSIRNQVVQNTHARAQTHLHAHAHWHTHWHKHTHTHSRARTHTSIHNAYSVHTIQIICTKYTQYIHNTHIIHTVQRTHD